MDNKEVRKPSLIRLDRATVKALKILAINLDRSYNSLMQEAAQDILLKYKKKKF